MYFVLHDVLEGTNLIRLALFKYNNVSSEGNCKLRCAAFSRYNNHFQLFPWGTPCLGNKFFQLKKKTNKVEHTNKCAILGLHFPLSFL